ncbi:MAG: hypothetical protein LH702_30815, partial [Phormidesmis sp. CAN_BIN44]|nr:hypothetical protein [Phormidesmis sp. CAN_BIN44]
LPRNLMRILLSRTILSITLLLQACSGRYQTPIAFPGTSNAASPTVQKSPIVTASQKPTQPAVAVSPTPTGERLNVCATISQENRRLVAFETASYFVNVCQKGAQGRIFYAGQEKGKPNTNVQVTASLTKRGYRAINGNTTYVVDTQSGGKLTVLQNGQPVFQEPAIGTIITANPGVTPRPPKGDTGADFRLTCTGGINNRNMYFTVIYTQESGFTTFELRQNGTDRLMSKGSVAFSSQNDQGQTIYRGAAKDADVVVVGLAPRYQKPFSEMSFSIDGQWGRGTCRQLG